MSGCSSGDVCSQEQRRRCCISHVFFNSATLNSDEIAAIHVAPSRGRSGDGGDGVFWSKNPRKFIRSGQVHRTADSSSSGSSSCCGPPVYEGDECFTFGDVLKAVDSLASLLRSILDADDPYLILSQSSFSVKSNYSKQRTSSRSKSAVSFIPSVKQLAESDNVYKPKILGLYMPPSVEYIVSVLSVLRCGEAFLPLDPLWPKDRILSVVSSANVDLIVTFEPSFYDVEKSGWLVEFGSCPVLSLSMKEIMEGCSSPLQLYWPCEKEQKRLFCYVLYTSGSTGEPKGVCGTEQGLLNRFMWMQELYPMHEGEILLFKTSISFIDHLQEFLGAMLGACTLVIPPFNELRKDPFSIVNFLQAYSINRLIAVPSLMRVILPTLKIQSNIGIGCSLKFLVLSGEDFPLSLWDELSSLLPRTSILNLYGSTEVSGDCTYFDCKMLPTILDTEALTSVPIGVPISNCDVLLVGENDTSKTGEIYVGGLCVSIGYIEASPTPLDYIKMCKNYSCNCCEDDCGSQVYYRTGDFARRLPGGDLVFLGRKDRTIKVHGQRVALEEIENIIRAHPDVIDAAVISHEDSGELSFLTAFLVLRHNNLSGNLVRSSVRSWLSSKVPLAMIPNRFVLIESLPMSSSGKVDYAFLASSTFFTLHVQDDIDGAKHSDNLEMIKKVYYYLLKGHFVHFVCLNIFIILLAPIYSNT
uniref:AMP dependent ligase n=1 Tax=Rhizophora mucronata TaxID=61149 RepID=A0A2P2KNT7_RHIMU